MARSHSERVVRNTGAGFLLKLVAFAMSFVVKTVFIYTLGKQYNGISTLFTDILHMLALAELGVGSAVTFALYKPIKEKDDRHIAALVNFYKKAYRIIALTVLLLGLACLPFLQYMVRDVPDIKEDIRLIFILYIVNSAGSYLLVYRSTLLTASERGYMISRISIYFALARTALECLLVLIFRNYILYLLVGILENLVRNYVISRKAGKLFPGLEVYKDEKLSREETRSLLTGVGALAVYKICQVLLSSTDSVIISWLLPAGVISVGLLGNYRMLFNVINKLYLEFFVSLRPSLGNMGVDADAERQHAIFRSTVFLTFWSKCFCCTALLVLSTPFIRDIWLGPSFQLPLSIVVAMTLNFYLSGMSAPGNAFRDSKGLFVQGWLCPLFMAIANIVLDILFIKPWGITGVLLATSMARLMTQVWYDPWLLYRRVFKRPVGSYFRAYALYALVTAGSCSLTFFLSRFLAGRIANPYLSFLASMLLCLLVPNALVIALFRRSAEFSDIDKRLRSLVRKLKIKVGGTFHHV